jgi:hypothetical protein
MAIAFRQFVSEEDDSFVSVHEHENAHDFGAMYKSTSTSLRFSCGEFTFEQTSDGEGVVREAEFAAHLRKLDVLRDAIMTAYDCVTEQYHDCEDVALENDEDVYDMEPVFLNEDGN